MIYVVRHGQTDWNAQQRMQGQTDVLLNDVGRAQVRALAEETAHLDIDKIFASDLSRTVETAEILNVKNLEIIKDKRLREICYGDYEGRSRSEIAEEDWERYNANPKACNGESPKEVFNRIKSFFDDLKKQQIKNALVISHGATIRVMQFYKNNPNKKFDEAEFQEFRKNHPGIKNAEITVFNS